MKFKFLMITSVAAIFCINILYAQNDSVLSFSLKEAQNYAIDNYFVSKNAKLDIESAKKKIWETTAIGLPQISASADYQHIPNPPTIEFQTGPNPSDIMQFTIAPENNTSYSARVSQLIFSGEYIVGLQASKTFRTFSEENYTKVKIDLRENISGTYFSLIILKENKRVLEKTLSNLKENLNELKKTFEAGLLEDTEVDQLTLTVKRTENDLTTLNNQISTLSWVFKYLLGLSSNINVELTDNIDDLVALSVVNDSLYEFIIEENINYKILSTNEKLQKLSHNREKTTFLPTISGFYSYSDQTTTSDFSPSINHVAGISARWTLFTSGMRNAKVAQARISYEKAKNIKIQEAERLKLTAQQATYDFNSALNKYNNEKENFKLSEKIFDRTTKKFKQGMVSSLELSLINTQFLQAQLTYSAAKLELLNAKVALDKAYNHL